MPCRASRIHDNPVLMTVHDMLMHRNTCELGADLHARLVGPKPVHNFYYSQSPRPQQLTKLQSV